MLASTLAVAGGSLGRASSAQRVEYREGAQARSRSTVFVAPVLPETAACAVFLTAASVRRSAPAVTAVLFRAIFVFGFVPFLAM